MERKLEIIEMSPMYELSHTPNQQILIEIQKAKNEIDLMRFRRYLGEQYKKEDQIKSYQLLIVDLHH